MKLTDQVVTLRPFRLSDIPRMAALANNEKIAKNLRDGFPNPYTLADAEQFLKMVMKQNPVTFFAIEYDGHYVGNISLMPQEDVYRQTAEIGYFIGEAFWGKGIATRAVKLITAYGFEKLGMVRIHTGVFEYNPSSMRVLEKCGFVKEGVFSKSVTKLGKVWDEHRYSLVNPALKK